jgi:hypothetical protein
VCELLQTILHYVAFIKTSGIFIERYPTKIGLCQIELAFWSKYVIGYRKLSGCILLQATIDFNPKEIL